MHLTLACFIACDYTARTTLIYHKVSILNMCCRCDVGSISTVHDIELAHRLGETFQCCAGLPALGSPSPHLAVARLPAHW